MKIINIIKSDQKKSLKLLTVLDKLRETRVISQGYYEYILNKKKKKKKGGDKKWH